MGTFLGLFIFLWWVFGQSTNRSQKISLLESSSNIGVDDIYQRDQYPNLIASLENICERTEKDTADIYVQKIVNKLSKSYEELPLHLQLTSSEKMHNNLARYHEWVEFSDDVWCTLKLILYATQSWLREYHAQKIIDSGLVVEIDTIDGWTLKSQEIKYELLDRQIEQLEPYDSFFDWWFEFKDGNQINVSRPDLIELSLKSKRIMELSVKKWFYKLMEAWLLDESDIYKLNEQITLNMNLSCDTLHGNYTITQKTGRNNQHIRFSSQEMPLGVNVCGNYFFLKDLSEHFYTIVIHEMGHHFYYHHDLEWNKEFQKICWEDTLCEAQDFVTEYAMTSPAEDYAEHFVKWFLWDIDVVSPKIDQKTLYFEKFLK